MPTALDPGQLNIPATLQRRQLTTDDQGGVSPVWQTVTETVWLHDDAGALSEVVAGETMITATRHRVTMRYRAGVAAEMRLLQRDGTAWYIQSAVDPDGGGRWLALVCSEAAPS